MNNEYTWKVQDKQENIIDIAVLYHFWILSFKFTVYVQIILILYSTGYTLGYNEFDFFKEN